MYKCLDCGSEFLSPRMREWEESQGEYMGRPVWQTMRLEVCPDCGSEDFEDGEVCPSCGEGWVEFDDELCDSCKTEFSEMLHIFRKDVESSMKITDEMFEELVTEWLERN